LEKPDITVAVGGIVRVANGCEIDSGRITRVGLASGLLPLFQTVEYLRSFLFGRAGWSALNSLLIVSGAFGVFRKDVVISIGGYRIGCIGEDMELVVRMHRHLLETKQEYQILFLPDAVCWTEVPESLRVLGRQRNRWQRGLIESLMIHKKMFFNRRYGTIGLLGFPYFYIFVMLAPVIELVGMALVIVSFGFGYIDLRFFGLFFAVTILFGSVLTTGSVLLEEISVRRYPKSTEILRMIAAGLVESIGYRQLDLWWRTKGCLDYLRGNTTWGNMERRRFGRK
jgi:cellulose synthase/poly-beta-1,6-N-acetylglucosamine synthase-like glycosyltransferase